MTRTSTWASTLGFGPKPNPPARTWYGAGTEASSTDLERDVRRPARTSDTQSQQYSQEPPPKYPTFSSRSSSGTPSGTRGRQSTSPGRNHELSEFLPRRPASSSSSSPPTRHNDERYGHEDDEDSLKCTDLFCHCGPHCAPLAIGGITCVGLSVLAVVKSVL
jgi:hypothetical protein